ncbi:MAG: HEAT repeat domain-containing protein [Candidatus Coatesbacteria bacterium]|nr:HEAT repeat domain-containing protein [Candidatus Coatesbacteria bacterium]
MFEKAKLNWHLRNLESESWKKREAAVKALIEIDEPESKKALLDALRDPAYEVRRAAAKGLGQLKVREAIDPLIALLGDESGSVRQYAASGLASLGERSWQQIIKGEKEDIDRLASCGDPRAIFALIFAMRQIHGFHERSFLRHRRAAAEALVELATKSPSFLKEYWSDIQGLAALHHSDTSGGGHHSDRGIGVDFPDEPKTLKT